MQLFTGKYTRLRALEPEDVELLYAWENDTMLWEVSRTQTPFSKHLLKKYLAISHQDIYTLKQLQLVIEDIEGVPVGLIDLFDFDPYNQRIGVGILINRKYENRGYGSEALNLVKNYVHRTLGVHQIYANIQSKNEKSLALFKKQGFQISALKKDWLKTFEGWEDEYFLQCLL